MSAEYSTRSFHLLCIMLCATSATLCRSELHTEDFDQNSTCSSWDIYLPTVEDHPYSVTVKWRYFYDKTDCITRGNNYVTRVTWTVKGQDLREAEVSLDKDSFEITGLQPHTFVNITISLCYVNKAGKKLCLDAIEHHTTTSVHISSEPRNFHISGAEPNVTTLLFDQPEVAYGPVDGYEYEVCKVKSCDDSPPRADCGSEKKLQGREKYAFQVTNLDPLAYYKIRLWAYNTDHAIDRSFDGDVAQLCVRGPPLAVSPIMDFDVRCSAESSTATVTWGLPWAAEYVPEGYKLEVDKFQRKQAGEKTFKWKHESYDVDPQSTCENNICRYYLKDSEDISLYDVSLSPFYKDVGPLQDYIVREPCYRPHLTPEKVIEVVDDPALSKTQQAFEVPGDLFAEMGGHIRWIQWLVAQDSQIDKCKLPEIWSSAHEYDTIKCYTAMVGRNEGYGPWCNKSDKVSRCVLGAEEACGRILCNGPLKTGVVYGTKIRAHFIGGYVDSKAAFFTAGGSSSGSNARAGGSLLLVTCIMVLILRIAWTRTLLQVR